MSEAFFSKKEFWVAGDKYRQHRIPGMIVTDKGTLLIYCEARTHGNDWALMDVMLIRSEDGGKTFGEEMLLAEGNAEHPTVNNPVMVQDKNGRIHFLYLEDYRVEGGKAYRRYSDDDGKTWSEKIDITAATDPDFSNAFAFGPGHGILMADGTLMVPTWTVPKHYHTPIRAHNPSVVSAFYSKDNGESWQLGERLYSTPMVVSPGETEACLTSDGGVYMTIRHKGGYRAATYSANGYDGWSELTPDEGLLDPMCFGAALAYHDDKHPHILLVANCEDREERKNVVIKGSLDNGKTWKYRKLIDSEVGGYVELGFDARSGTIYLLYERFYGEAMRLATFNCAWLTDEI